MKTSVATLIALLLVSPALTQEPDRWIGQMAAECDPAHQIEHAEQSLPSVPWLTTKRVGDLVYFVYASPAQLSRFDLGSRTWLADIALTDTPTAFTADAQKILPSLF